MELTLKDIERVWITEKAIHIKTKDGKTAQEFFADYPRLAKASLEERKDYKKTPFGLYWEGIDEELSYAGFFKTQHERSMLGELFDFLGVLNVSAFARRLGISQPLMAAYLNGTKRPGKKRRKQITDELHKIGNELREVELS